MKIETVPKIEHSICVPVKLVNPVSPKKKISTTHRFINHFTGFCRAVVTLQCQS